MTLLVSMTTVSTIQYLKLKRIADVAPLKLPDIGITTSGADSNGLMGKPFRWL